MNWQREWVKLAVIVAVFLACFWLPVERLPFDNALTESLRLARWYAREHVLLCLVPAFFIAGAIGVFVGQASVMKYMGAKANKVLAYGVASVSGSVLAVCSCTVLPLFAGIYRMGAGLGPATAFLYSGPAINVLAIILTARILGIGLGVARAVGAIVFSVVIGLVMHVIYRKEELEKVSGQLAMPEPQVSRPLWQNALFFATMVAILVFANWGAPREFTFDTATYGTFTAAVVKEPEFASDDNASLILEVTGGPRKGEQLSVKLSDVREKTAVAGVSAKLWKAKWIITGVVSVAFGFILILWFDLAWWKVMAAGAPATVLALLIPHEPMIPFAGAVVGLSLITSTKEGEAGDWFAATWGFAKQILPLLFFGVLVAGFLLGRPDHEGLISSEWVSGAVGGNSLRANLFASVAGAFMYFATLTEVPILQGLIGAGMGRGPALALLLAGPALSLPNMLVIRSVLGTQKTLVYISLVVVMATVSGLVFGTFFG